ncbi:hypothetical protein PPACK8108_LOCUS10806 [Phakopsora pachyrhizi]|uniref:Uncharacterized protein n=1 Tax=Phakopsora pachyrhizi TaxID=170000 RepID=A0AAV0B182_PHAPC|nr:hypothetical protein PPACK8108_LOCUS10806 [Phakopsora pachyrhizi]
MAFYLTLKWKYSIIFGVNSGSFRSRNTFRLFSNFSLQCKGIHPQEVLAQFYESPLKLPLLGSAAVSVLFGNMDNAICITAAILIVVVGETKPIKKQIEKVEIQNRLPDISERTNVALMGTLVRSGNGSGGRQLKDSTAALNGQTGQEAEHNLVFGHWGDLPDWSIAEEELARDVYGWQAINLGNSKTCPRSSENV